jgi:hypothetical protein
VNQKIEGPKGPNLAQKNTWIEKNEKNKKN